MRNLFRFYRSSDGFELAGGSKPEPAPAPEPTTLEPAADPAPAPDPAPDTQSPASAEPAPEPRNVAEWLLRMKGFEGDKIPYGDAERDIDSLTAEEQLDIVAQEYETLSQQVQSSQYTEEEQAYLQALRTGGALGLANYIMENNPAAQVQRATPEQLVEQDLRTRYGEDYTDDDIAAEIEAQRNSGRLERNAEILRKKLGQQAGSLDLNGFQTQHVIAPEVLSSTVDSFTEFEIENVAKFEINEQARAYLKNQLTPKDGKPAPFDEKLKDPKVRAQVAFWLDYGPHLMTQVAQLNYDNGRAEADALLAQMKGGKQQQSVATTGYQPKFSKKTGSAGTANSDGKGKVKTF